MGPFYIYSGDPYTGRYGYFNGNPYTGRYGYFHYKDKTGLSYLVLSYAGKTAYLHWDGPQIPSPISVSTSAATAVTTSEPCIYSWWRHQMETFSTLLAICAWKYPVPGEFPAQRPVTQIFDVFLSAPEKTAE